MIATVARRRATLLALLACIVWHVALVAARKDLYKVLGIDRNASDDDIKRAYKREARKWHPDKNPNNAEEAQERFIDVTNAYETLSDPRKRRQYEHDGSTAHEGGPAGGGGRGGAHRGGGTTFHFRSGGAGRFEGFDFFDEMFGRPRARRRAPDIRSSISDTLTDANFDDWIATLGEGEIALVEGYGVRCHACASIYPAWEEAARKTSQLHGVRMGRFDAHANRRLTRFFGLKDIPAIMAVDRHKRWQSLYGRVTASVLQQFASKHMRVPIPLITTLEEWRSVAHAQPHKMLLLLFTNHDEPSLHYKSLALAHATNAVFAMAARSSRRSSPLWQHFGVRSVPQLLLFPHGGVVASAQSGGVREVSDPDRLTGAQVSYSHLADMLDTYAAVYALPELTRDTADDLCSGDVVCVVLCTHSQHDHELDWLLALNKVRSTKSRVKRLRVEHGTQPLPVQFVTMDVRREAPMAAAFGVDVAAGLRVALYVPSHAATCAMAADWDDVRGDFESAVRRAVERDGSWTVHEGGMPAYVDPLLWDKSLAQRVAMWLDEATADYVPESPQVVGQWAILLIILVASLRYLWDNFEEVLLDEPGGREPSARASGDGPGGGVAGKEKKEQARAHAHAQGPDATAGAEGEKNGAARPPAGAAAAAPPPPPPPPPRGLFASLVGGFVTAVKVITMVVFVVNAYVLLFNALP